MTTKFVRIYNFFELVIVYSLLALLMIVLLYATIQLIQIIAVTLVHRMTGATSIQADSLDLLSRLSLLHDVFGAFLLILIGLELAKTVVMYLDEHVLHVEVVLTVAMIAIARHAIDINYKEANPLILFGISAMIVALTLGYFLYRKSLHYPVGQNPS